MDGVDERGRDRTATFPVKPSWEWSLDLAVEENASGIERAAIWEEGDVRSFPDMAQRIYFFDIDQTLLSSFGAGMKAIGFAGRELFGEGFTTEGVPVAGRIDPLILGDLIERQRGPGDRLANSPEEFAELHGRFRQRYAHHLERLMSSAQVGASALGGVMPLLEAVEGDASVCRALLTGNYEETGCIKLRACGIAPERFGLAVWGDQSPSNPPTRRDLPQVGLDMHARRYGEHRRIDPRQAVVIGDTPHDVDCAHACGCRCLAVATGHSSEEELRQAGADEVVADLRDTEKVVELLRHLTS